MQTISQRKFSKRQTYKLAINSLKKRRRRIYEDLLMYEKDLSYETVKELKKALEKIHNNLEHYKQLYNNEPLEIEDEEQYE